MAIHPTAKDIHNSAAIEPHHVAPPVIAPGHFHTRPGYLTVREQGTEDWLVIYTAVGSGRIGYRSGVYHTGPGDLILWRPHTYHNYGIAESCLEWEILWAHFLPWPHWHRFLFWPTHFEGIRYLHVSDENMRRRVEQELLAMNRFARGPYRESTLLAANALERALLLSTTGVPSSEEGSVDTRILAALDYLCRNMGEKLTIEKLGRHCGLSSSRLSHLFKEQVGVTPLHYLEEQRIKEAKKLLALSSLSIKEIAAMVGFESQFYFTRRFTLKTGRSPSRFRGNQ